MIKFILAFILSATGLLGSPLPDYPFVYATGTGTREIAPNKARIHFNIKTSEKDLEKAYSAQARIASAVITFAESLKIPTDSIVAEAIDKTPTSEGYGKDKQTSGYELVRSVKVEINNLEAYPKFIDFLYRQNSIESIYADFDIKNNEEISKELLGAACKDALAKATALAAGFSRKIKTIRAISEAGFDNIQKPFGLSASGNILNSSMSNSGTEREFRSIPLSIKLEREVYIICEIR